MVMEISLYNGMDSSLSLNGYIKSKVFHLGLYSANKCGLREFPSKCLVKSYQKGPLVSTGRESSSMFCDIQIVNHTKGTLYLYLTKKYINSKDIVVDEVRFIDKDKVDYYQNNDLKTVHFLYKSKTISLRLEQYIAGKEFGT